MTETCLLSDRHSLSVSAGPTLTSANVHTQLLEWLFERRNSLLQSERQLERQECKREAGEWVQWARREQPVARTGQYAPMHLPPPPPPPPSTSQIRPPPLLPFLLHLLPTPVFPFKRNSFNSICLFATFTRRQYHFHREILSTAFLLSCLLVRQLTMLNKVLLIFLSGCEMKKKYVYIIGTINNNN